MEANSRINRRSRPRPYDLRRKVLLKNFLREQMTYIPQTRLTSSAQDSHVDFAEKSPDSSEMDEDLQELNDENSSIIISPMNTQANSTVESDRNDLVANPTEGCNSPNHEAEPAIKANSVNTSKSKSKISRFASLMSLRSKSKRKAIKGIIKAKKVCKKAKSPVKSKSYKTGLERILSEQSGKSFQTSKNSFKSIFSLLKSRKDRKRTDVNKQSCVSDELCESTESADSDDSEQMSFDKCKEELSKAQKLNKLLQEENKLLSESLSYFMSSPSVDSSCTVPLQDSNQNIGRFSNYDHESSSSDDYNWNNRPRISRSKSVREHGNPKHKGTHRTRSMNCHLSRSNLSHSPTPIMEYSAEPQKINIPCVRQKDNLSVNRSNRVIQRRFSMPERFLSENDSANTSSTSVSIFRNRQRTRSMSCHDNHSSFYIAHSVYSEPSEENSNPRAKRNSVLASLPVNIAGRVVQRRSSMPERILSVNNKSRRCHRSGSVREGSSRTPFHSLPSYAFY